MTGRVRQVVDLRVLEMYLLAGFERFQRFLREKIPEIIHAKNLVRSESHSLRQSVLVHPKKSAKSIESTFLSPGAQTSRGFVPRN
jgi:hypothetical protein